MSEPFYRSRVTVAKVEGVHRRARLPAGAEFVQVDLLDADWTFVNQDLAQHYGITGVRGPVFPRVKLQNPNRVGLLTEADLREFFTSWYAKRHEVAPGADNGVALAQFEADIDATVAQVIDFARTASAQDGCYMRELARAVEEVIDELAS